LCSTKQNWKLLDSVREQFRGNFWLYISPDLNDRAPLVGRHFCFYYVYYVAFNSIPTGSQVVTRYAGRRGRALLAILCAMLVGLAWVLSTSAIPQHKTRKISALSETIKMYLNCCNRLYPLLSYAKRNRSHIDQGLGRLGRCLPPYSLPTLPR